MRFSKLKVARHLDDKLHRYLDEFEALNQASFDPNLGWQQCGNQSTHVHRLYAAIETLLEVGRDLGLDREEGLRYLAM